MTIIRHKIILSSFAVALMAVMPSTLDAAGAVDANAAARKAAKLKPSKPQNTAPSKAIMVLDASGSMWGQIKGKAKIFLFPQKGLGSAIMALPIFFA